jgi:hypothetical protein
MRDFIHKMLTVLKTLHTEIDSNLTKILLRTLFLYLGKPSESGGYILYYFRHINDLPISCFVPPSDLNSIDNLVFIDDVTLTAGPDGQAYSELKKYVTKYKDKKVFLLTLIASKTSISELKKINVDVITAIILDERNQCFCEDSDIFHTYPKYIESCKKFVQHYGNKINSKIPLGYKNGEYTFGFFYNTPDNTLPIFWGTDNGWCPIFKRYDKHYKKTELVIDERFL